MVIRPVLLRPPLPRRPSVNALIDLPFHSPLRSTTTSCRCDGVVGLKVFNAIASDSRRDVDPLTFAERDDCLLIVGTLPDTTAKTLKLALDPDRVDRGYLDLEQPFDRRLDLTLCGSQRHTKDHLVVLRDVRRLFSDHRGTDDVKHLLLSQRRRDTRDHAKPAHLRRASSCRTASRVRTSVSRRKMRTQRLGFGFADMSRVDQHELALVLLGRQRNLEAEPTHLLLQVERVRANHRPENTRAPAELRRSQAALPSAAGALLLVRLLSGSPDFADPLRFVGTGTAFCQLPIDDAGEDVAADRKPEDLVGEFEFADLLVVEISDGELHGEASPAGLSGGNGVPRKAAGNGNPSGALRLAASLTST